MTFEPDAVASFLEELIRVVTDAGALAALSDSVTDELTPNPYSPQSQPSLYEAWEMGYWTEGTVDVRSSDAIVYA